MTSRGIRDLAVEAMVDAHRVSRARQRDALGAQHSIVVIDGDIRVRTLLLRVLEERGHNARATDGLRALDALPDPGQPPCVLLLDVGTIPDDAPLPRRLVEATVAVVRVSDNPASADLAGWDPERPVLKPLFVDDWLRLIDARCRRHAPSA
jgi:hypothetical protein